MTDRKDAMAELTRLAEEIEDGGEPTNPALMMAVTKFVSDRRKEDADEAEAQEARE